MKQNCLYYNRPPSPPKCIPSDNRFTSLFLLPIFVDMFYLWHTQITKNDKVSDGQEVMHSILIQALSCDHVLESVKALTLHAEDWVYESEPRQTYVLKTGKDSSTAKRSSEGISYTGPWRCQYKWMKRDTVGVTRYKNPHCSLAIWANVKIFNPSSIMMTSRMIIYLF